MEERSPSAKLRTVLLPSAPIQAPVPDAGSSTNPKLQPRRESNPPTVVMLEAPLRSPTQRSGSLMPSVPMTKPSSARLTSPIAPHAAVGVALMAVPRGAVTRIGRRAPALIGLVGSRKAFTIVYVAVQACAGPRFVGPST